MAEATGAAEMAAARARAAAKVEEAAAVARERASAKSGTVVGMDSEVAKVAVGAASASVDGAAEVMEEVVEKAWAAEEVAMAEVA